MIGSLLFSNSGSAAAQEAAGFQPDPKTVQRFGAGYRYPQAGWIVLHVEGEPYERGIQQGRLLAPEIAAYMRCMAAGEGSKAPSENFDAMRNLVNALFLRRYNREQIDEMRGIADGASLAGARYDGRSLDIVDIMVLNSAEELESLESSLKLAMPEVVQAGKERKKPVKPIKITPKPRGHCNALAATGPATKDGKVIFAHVTMYSLYNANFFNVWMDVQPKTGHRFVMQCAPGTIHSGMDYIINDAGILLCETTLPQTESDLKGSPVSFRIREASQFADSIDSAAELLSKDTNGLCSAEWILADLKTNEIALLSQGLHTKRLYRSSKKEWFGGAEGFYWSCNNPKDKDLRLEMLPGGLERPSESAAFEPTKRDAQWLKFYAANKGRIDEDSFRQLMRDPGMDGFDRDYHAFAAFAVDAKYTTTDLGLRLQSRAAMGPQTRPVWQPSFTDRKYYPEIKPQVCHPWTTLGITPPKKVEQEERAVDLHNPAGNKLPEVKIKETDGPGEDRETSPAWHGTLIPKTDADIWLTTAFANYERIVALEKPSPIADEEEERDDDEFAVSLVFQRAEYELGVRRKGDVPLAETKLELGDENWHHVATGKGVYVLNALRRLMGAEKFDQCMEAFGQANTGKEVTTAQFRAFVEERSGRKWGAFFDAWLKQPGLPKLRLDKCETHKDGGKWLTNVTVSREHGSPPLSVPVTVEFGEKETTHSMALEQEHATLAFHTAERPDRVIVDKYGTSSRGNGDAYSILTFDEEMETVMIVYGTLDEVTANAEAASLLQRSLSRRYHSGLPPVKKDSEVTEGELKSHHILMIGRPDTNRLIAQQKAKLPVSFGPQSFSIRGETYAHPESAVIMAIANPWNPRYSVVVVSSLGCLATVRTAQSFEDASFNYAPIVILGHGKDENAMVPPAKELIHEFSGKR